MSPSKLHINRAYANVYSDRRAREEKRKLEAHFGGSAKEVLKSALTDNESDEDSECSDSESDFDGVKDSALDKGFWRTYGALSANDPILYDDSKSLYTELESENNGDVAKKLKKMKPKPYFLKDHERDYLLYGENGKHADNEIDSSHLNLGGSRENSSEVNNSPSYLKEKMENNNLIEYLKGNLDEVESDVKKQLMPIKEKLIASRNLTRLEEDREAFLIDFLVNKRWQGSGSEALSSNDVVDEDNFLELQEEFESKFNMQHIEPDLEFANKYPRAFGFEDKSESESGDDIFIEKSKSTNIIDDDEDELKRIRIKLGYSEKDDALKSVIRRCNTFENDKLSDGVENLVKCEEMNSSDKDLLITYPRTITETMRRSNKMDRAERRLALKERRRKEKEIRHAELRLLQKLEHEHLQKRLHQIYSSAGFKKDDKNSLIGADDLEEDFDPNTHDSKMAQVFDDAYYCCDSNLEEKPEFSDNDELNDLPQTDEAKLILQRIDQLDEMEAEDFIDDVKCRFKYRQVPANNFGLSTEEILKANDKELNSWVSVKKMSQFRDEFSEMKDFKKYNSNHKQHSKERILTSLFTAESDPKPKEKKRKKKRKFSQTNTISSSEINCGNASVESVNSTKVKKKKLSSPLLENEMLSEVVAFKTSASITASAHQENDLLNEVVNSENSVSLSTSLTKKLMKRKQKRLKKRNSKKRASNPVNFVVEDRLKDLGFSSKKLKHMTLVKA